MANSKLSVKLTAELDQLKSQLDRASKMIDDFGRREDKNFQQRKKNVTSEVSLNNSLFSSLKNLALAYISLQSAVQLLGRAFDTSLKIDQIKSALTFILGSTEAAEAQFDKLAQMADHLGLELTSLADSYKLFAGAAMTAGVSQNDTNRIFEAFAQAASVLKLSADDTRGALNAVSQMISKGNVQAEELRGQLGERLPGAFNLAAKAMGVTTKELNKMLEQGQVLATDLLPRLTEELEKTFGAATVEKTEGLVASVNRLSNTFTKAVESGNTSTFFKDIVDGANNTLQALVKLTGSKAWNFVFNNEAFQKENIMGTGAVEFMDRALIKTQEIAKETEKVKKTWDSIGGGGAKTAPRAKEENLTPITGAKDMVEEANALLQLYKEYPGALNVLGEAYLRNPLFRDLVNGTLKKGVDDLRESTIALTESTTAFTSDATIERINAMNTELLKAGQLVGDVLANAFEDALADGKDFFDSLISGLKALIIKLIAAAAAALVLNILLGGTPMASGGTANFGTFFKMMSGFDIGGFTGGRQAMSPGVVAPGVSDGRVEFVIHGDVLHGVLERNGLIRNRIS
jgi:tape measure domain-containing protein